MTRGTETVLRRALVCAACVMLGGAAYIVFETFGAPVEATRLNLVLPSESVPVQKAPTAPDPRIARLSVSKLTRTIVPVVPKIEVVAKPPTPKLESFLRVKGIMDTGNAKTTEAIIELLHENKTRFVRAGEAISEASATVVKIDSGVVFLYDGKNVLLQVNGETGVELAPGGKSVGLSVSEHEKVRVP